MNCFPCAAGLQLPEIAVGWYAIQRAALTCGCPTACFADGVSGGGGRGRGCAGGRSQVCARDSVLALGCLTKQMGAMLCWRMRPGALGSQETKLYLTILC